MAVLDALGIDRAHLVGLSMGGFTALHTGLRHPDRVRSLAIAGVGYRTAHDDARKADVENLAAFYADDPEAAAASHGSASVRDYHHVPGGLQIFVDTLRAAGLSPRRPSPGSPPKRRHPPQHPLTQPEGRTGTWLGARPPGWPCKRAAPRIVG